VSLKVDAKRKDYHDTTGYYVRALRDGEWDSVDIAELTKISLREWLSHRTKTALVTIIVHLLGH